jgi:membrane protein involved in D-alanine export
MFFPTISSGPIDRYRRFEADWNASRSRAKFLQDLDGAVHQVFTGFLYKFILAALVSRYWLDRAEAGHGLWHLVSYAYAYTFYLFFDFAGYSCFAIGLSYLLGVNTPRNFNKPFLARNIREFWDRWHISLSTWFRDHVYMRFVLAATKGRWFKGRYTASILGFYLAFGLMGLWHGTQWYYLAYGLYHATLLSGFDVFSRWNKKRKLWGDGPLWRVAATLITFHLICFGLLMFSGRLAARGAAPSESPIVASTDNREGGPNQAQVNPDLNYQGFLDKADVNQITGWVWDRTRPNVSMRVDIYDGETLLATIPADRLRQDLIKNTLDDGKHAFVFPTPKALKDGRPHPIRVQVNGSRYELGHSPRIIESRQP